MGKRSVSTVSHVDIQRYLFHVSENGATLNMTYRDLGVLRLFYDFLNLGGVVNYVAPRFVKVRRPLWNSPSPLTESQIQKLIEATRTLRERALIEFFYGTGCRLSELRRLKIEDLDLDARCARLTGKFGKLRTVLYTKITADALRAYIGQRAKGFVFKEDLPTQKGCLFRCDGRWRVRWTVYNRQGRRPHQRTMYLGWTEQLTEDEAKKKQEALLSNQRNLTRPPRNRPLSGVAVQQIVKKVAGRAGLKNIGPHSLRRAFATHLYEHGADIYVIKTLMGHVWIHTTMRYANMGLDRLTKTFDECHPRTRLNEGASG